MKLERGLFTDSAEIDQPQGTYRFAKNLVDSNTIGAKENEKGFTEIAEIAPYPVIGIVPVLTGFVVFSTDNTDCEIGIYENAAYTTVYNSPTLAFSTTTPIKGEFRTNVNGERVVAWIDDNNKPRIINIDNPAVTSIEDLNLFQSVQYPKLTTYAINDSGGTLPTGAYIVFTKYLDENGAETAWFVHEKVFYINDEPKSGSFDANDGAVGGTLSSKSITIGFSECDTTFSQIAIGYMQISNQIVTPFYVTKKTNNSVVNFTITGAETVTKLSLEEVLTSGASYTNAKAITQVNGQLVLGNLTSDPLPDIQKAALGIKINYNTSLVSVISNSNSHKDTLPPSLMPGEVYAFYLGVELTNGQRVFYHIPGRAPITGETGTASTDGITHKVYQISDTNNAPGAATNMGYWENENEQYPNEDIYNGTALGTADLRNVNVRHHRTPSLTYLSNITYAGNSAVGVTSLPRIGIDVTNVNIPALAQSQIKRWGIYFAKKDNNNSIVLGSDLLHFNWSTETDSTVFWSTGGNWAVDAERNGGDTWKNFPTAGIKNTSQRGHSLDLLMEIGKTVPLFAWFHYKLRGTGGNTQYTGFRSSGGRLSVSGDNRGQCNSAVIDFTVPGTVTKTATSAIRKLNNFQYLPQNAQISKFKSKDNEGCFVTEFSSPVGGISTCNSILRTNSSGQTADEDQFATGGVYITGEDTMYMQYGRLLSDAHTSFLSQELVPMEGSAGPASTSLSGVYGGDTFLCYMSYLTTAPLGEQGVPENSLNGIRMWKAYIGYSRRNWNYRHQTNGELGTYYHGKTDPRTLFYPNLLDNAMKETSTLISTSDALNKLEYNEDYNHMNTQVVGVIYSPDLVNQTQFPTTIIYSPVQNEESELPSWRLFPANNRYVMPKHKGDLINLQGISNRDLLIHHQYSLFKTRTDISLNANQGQDNVYLKSNELFGIQPEELVSSSSGYAGTQNKFGCLLTKAGYIFVDDLQGKVFNFSGQSLDEISSNGMRKFFRDSMNIQADNPFNGNGYTMVYDEFYNRLLLTKNQGATSWTISYSPQKKVWVSYHDYVPDYMFELVDNKVYSFKDNVLYRHNTGDYGVFYEGVIYPALIDVVQNPEPAADKVVTGIIWTTESYSPSGVLQYNDTFNYLTIRALDHCTNKTLLSRNTGIDTLYNSNIRNLNRYWYFHDIRDISTQPGFVLGFYDNYNLDLTKLNTNNEWYNSRKFVDKFVICRFEYNNDLNNKLLITETNLEYRYAR